MAQDAASSAQSNASAKEFVEKAGTSGLAEVADHTKANQELVTAIKGKGMQVPSSRTDMHKAMMEKFQQQDAGKNFDRAYMEQMVEDHKAAVELFETAADDDGLDINLRGYAKQTLPTLREHLKEAQTIESKLTD
jgi:putative membrane protein